MSVQCTLTLENWHLCTRVRVCVARGRRAEEGRGGVEARPSRLCSPMRVDDIVKAFRDQKMMAWTGPKRTRVDGDSDTEAEDEEQERTFRRERQVEAEARLDLIRRA